MRHLLSITDLSVEEIIAIFKRTKEYKAEPLRRDFKDKTLAMLFEKPSTRTRVSFEVASNQLGGSALYLNYKDTQLGRGETASDTAKVLSRYCDLIMARVNSHDTLEELKEGSRVPVINGLSDLEHPCQVLADMFTIHENLGQLHGLKLVYIGNAKNNVTHSLLLACAKLGINMTVASPEKLSPDKSILRASVARSKASGARIEHVSKPELAVKNADIIYTDTWFSMGDKVTAGKRRMLKPYQLNAKILNKSNASALVMHCLPAHRGEEITSPVMDSEQSVVWDQAENRMHVQKGIMSLLV